VIPNNLKPSEYEKIQLERQATRLFISCFASRYKKHIIYQHHNLPIKPDVSCTLDGRPLDLEIAHLYGSEQEAMRILGRELSTTICEELRALADTSGTGDRLLKVLNRILANKSQKYYDSKRVWLVIRNAHPAWNVPEITAVQNKISLPDKHPFEQIWVIGDFTGTTGILRIFPE
jgi:hypothetical protein